MVSIPACHAGDPGSIPGRGVSFTYYVGKCSKYFQETRCRFHLGIHVNVMQVARLAQSVEHETLNLEVVGSSPTLCDILELELDMYAFAFCQSN